MKGKYSHSIVYWMYKLYRLAKRYQISKLIDWENAELTHPLEPGCTVLLGMCSKLPKVIYANLACLQQCVWNDLKAVYIIVDCRKSDLPPGTEEAIIRAFPQLNISFFYYSEQQYKKAEQLKLPYLYAWMSWCIGLKHTETQTVLIHDYDALILSRTVLKRRYDEFQSSSAKLQGIEWYKGNGFIRADRLACTFECFADVEWLRSFKPIELFNNVGTHQGRSVDYDILLEIQARYLEPIERTISPMSQENAELVHPSQMIHQYTMFRKFPGRSLPCYSMILLPLFDYLAGEKDAFKKATDSITQTGMLMREGVVINLRQLEGKYLHWGLQQSVQALVTFQGTPPTGFFAYYQALYTSAGCQLSGIQHEFATSEHQKWFAQAQQLSVLTAV